MSRTNLIRIVFIVVWLGAAILVGRSLIPQARGAEFRDLSHCSGSGQGPIDCPRDYYGVEQPQFGTFSEGYLKRRAEREARRKRRAPKPETQCFDFERNDSPKGFAHALENPVPCKDLVQ